ncbi:NADAR family protein [Streptomyces sp. H51]|uniref:NADAR family protein n=1 Tax=Streptomyces sp. H51 TaxID=3111770 RepID=UPI002D7A2136|nr:NADAR family protein [Streptomyces sp. H51]
MERVTGKIDSRESLVRAVRAGARIKYLHFWGHRPGADGRVGPGCLSQWWPSPFTVDSVTYATAEHWMMAGKARLFGDAEAERQALAAGHPAQAKKAGRLVRGFDEAVWERERFGIVVEGSVHKFAAHADLREFLLNTGERSETGVPPAEGRGRVLVEASPMDRVWGIGLGATDEAATDPERWRGANLLGFALMEARERLAGSG